MGTGQLAVAVDGLAKVFKVPVRDPGLKAAAKSLVKRTHRDVVAVGGVSFAIEPGEIVGFLGPNGAGKTTTLKMLSGLLHPTSGSARVLGHEPWKRERAYLQRMTLVMGNRNQLQWDLPAMDSFELTRAVYRLPEDMFRAQRDELIELLDLGPLVDKPVRNLSLGERMKAEIANSLLHRPEVMFLDEPTLGLDVTMQRRIRGFLADFNAPPRLDRDADHALHGRRRGAVRARDRDPPRGDPVRRSAEGAGATASPGTRRSSSRSHEVVDLSSFGEVIDTNGARVTLRVAREATPAITTRLLSEHDVLDLTVEDPPIDDVIELAFASATVTAADGDR